eukprot:2046586-Rhodomonas_salina.1
MARTRGQERMQGLVMQGKLGTAGCLAAALPRGSLGRGGRGLWLERRCGSTLAEISARNGSNGVVRGA